METEAKSQPSGVRQPLAPLRSAENGAESRGRTLASPGRRQPYEDGGHDTEGSENGPARKRQRTSDSCDAFPGAGIASSPLRMEHRLPRPVGGKTRGVTASLFRRETQGIPGLYRQSKPSTRFRLKEFVSRDVDTYSVVDDDGQTVPPFVCKYSSSTQRLLAAADESGAVILLDTSEDRTPSDRLKEQVLAHNNAIFDLCWTPDDSAIITASGDQTAVLWDAATLQRRAIFSGHRSSVKTVSACPSDPNMIATGSRDGRILVWDVRCSSTKVFQLSGYVGPPVYTRANMIQNAHFRNAKHSKDESKSTKRHGTASVTQVLFLGHGSHLLASTGSADGVVKLWDLRQHGSYTTKENPTPFASSFPVPDSNRPRGFTSLSVDPSGSKLFASCTDNRIYMFSTKNLTSPWTTFSEPTYTSYSNGFFVRTTVSPDGAYVASGSSSGTVYIWEIDHPERPAYLLPAHRAECSSVSWCPTDFEQLASCSDEGTIRIWNMDADLVDMRGRDPEVMRKTAAAVEGQVGQERPTKVPPISKGESSPITPNAASSPFSLAAWLRPGTPARSSPIPGSASLVQDENSPAARNVARRR